MKSSIIEIMNKFPNQETYVKFLEQLRWNNKSKCIFCSSEETFPIIKELRHHCKKCLQSYLNGFCFKYSHQKEKSMFKILIIKCLFKK